MLRCRERAERAPHADWSPPLVELRQPGADAKPDHQAAADQQTFRRCVRSHVSG
jgi:hypothetical protein